MYSLRDILTGCVKKERNAEGSPCNEQSSKTLFSKETFECSIENGNPVSSCGPYLELGHQTGSLLDTFECSKESEIPASSRACDREPDHQTGLLPDAFECSKESGNPAPFRARDCELDLQTGSLPLTSTHLVSLQERISSQEDYSKIRKRNVQGILPDKKRLKDDLVHRNRETLTSTSCSTATLMALTSVYPVPFFGEKSTHEDSYDQISNMMSSYQKNSLPFKSAINPLPSRGNFYVKEDQSRIQLSKVYKNPYNAKAVKAFINTPTKKQYQVSLKHGSDQISGHSKHQEMLSEEQPIKQNRKMSFKNESGILHRNQFTKTTAPNRDLSRSHPTRGTSNFQSTIVTRRDQFPDMSARSKNGSVYRYETENYSLHNSSLEIIPCYHVYNIRPSTPNSHFTITPQHFRIMEEIAQQDDLTNKIGVYKPEISFLNEKVKQCSQKSICGISKNHTRSRASSCQSYRLEQPRAHHAPPVDNMQRPSVIMVPASWSNIASRESHVPLKVDASFTEQSDGQKGNVDSSDDDDDGENEKYFQVNMDGKTATFKLTKEDWKRIPISTFPSGGRLLSGDWRKIFVNKVKESNPWCSLRFKNNHVRSENSRKIFSAVFFRGAAECKRPECNVKVRFAIQKEKGKDVDVTYVGNVCHSSEPISTGPGEVKISE